MTAKESRRNFFGSIFETKARKVMAGLDVYQSPLSLSDAYHLLRRTCIVVDHSFAKSLVGRSAESAVDEIINNTKTKPSPPPPSFWNDSFPDPRLDGAGAADNPHKIRSQNNDLQLWWIRLMQADHKSMSERLAFFWHDHFTSQYNICNLIPAQLMYRQNALFRKHELGNFTAFLKDITLDGAMLLYLNGNDNRNEAPNENYARELFELFTIGVGNYTEGDVRQAAKALTGWKINYFKNDEKLYSPIFRSGFFDNKEKVVFGTTITVDYELSEQNVRLRSINALIDAISSKKGTEMATFISNKLYNQLVYSKPNPTDQAFIQSLAKRFQENNYQLEPLVRAILTSSHFFDPQNRGIQIVSPLESVVNFASHFDVSAERINIIMKDLGLELLAPPTVAGWSGYRSWITTKSLPLSILYFSEFVSKQSEEKVGQWARQFEGYNDSYKLTEEISSLFLGRLPNENRMESLMNKMLGGAPYYEWSNLAQNTGNAGLRIKVLMNELVKTPEFYLR